MSLYEDILEKSTAVPEFVKEAMRRAVVIDCQNVADYYFFGTDQEQWHITRDFPNVAPPWPLYWMESRMPSKINTEGRMIVPVTAGMRTGFLFNVRSRNEQGWKMEATMIAGADASHDVGNINVIQYDISPQGVAAWGPPNFKAVCVLLAGKTPDDAQEDERAFMSQFVGTSIHVPFLATTFAHCKNTSIRELLPNRAARRRAVREGRELLRLHTLEIGPVKQILAYEGQSVRLGIKQALHVCRGHFKDYRERGLFGKIKGLFWWDMHIRGDFDKGTTGKDYRIVAQ